MINYELINEIKTCAEKQLYEQNVYDVCQTIIDMNYKLQRTALSNKMELDDKMDELLRKLANV